MERFEFFVNHLVRRLLQFHTFEENEIADFSRHTEPNVVFPGACSRNGARLVRSISARADDRRVADATRHLALQAAGRGAGRDVALPVERHYTDRAMDLRIGRLVKLRNRNGGSVGGTPAGRGGTGFPSLVNCLTRIASGSR